MVKLRGQPGSDAAALPLQSEPGRKKEDPDPGATSISLRLGKGRTLACPPTWLLILMLVAYFLAAVFAIHLTGQAGNIATLWPAGAILTTALIRRPKAEWPILLALGAAADWSGNLMMGGGAAAASGVAAADCLEAFVAATFSLRFVPRLHKLEARDLMLIFLVFAVSSAMAAGLGSAWLAILGEVHFLASWPMWFLADLLGLVIVAPLLLIWTDSALRQHHSPAFWFELVLHAVVVSIAAYLAFNIEQPFLFILFPFLLLSTFRLGLLGATTSTTLIAFIAMWFTLKGQGPIVAPGFTGGESIQAMQAFVAVTFLLAFPTAVIMERDRLMKVALGEARDAADRARDEAEEATRAKSDFLAMMSHEIRTPLNSVIGFTDLLLEDQRLDAQQRRQVGLIHDSGTVLLTLVNDILNFSKIEAGKVELAVQPFTLPGLIDNIISIVRSDADAKGLELSVEVDPQLDGFHLGDQGRLRQILLNLLNNAVKFTASGAVRLSAVRVHSADCGDQIRLTVTDSGIGIPYERHRSLFERFTQADPSITRQYGGTGLGLAISKRLIEVMGGEIGFSSELGAGSTFWIKLVLPRAETAPGGPPSEAREAVHRPARVLLVEDLALNRELACAILRRAGHEVETAENGEVAVQVCQSRRFDLILMDIQMPKLDGIRAAKIIRSTTGPCQQVPILALSANVLPEQVDEYFRAGMNGHVAKPINQADLHRAIACALREGEERESDGEVGGENADRSFDAAVYDKVSKIFPDGRLPFHLKCFEADIASTFSEPMEIQLRREGAHKLVSQAGMLGFMKLSRLCRDLEQACAHGGAIDPQLSAAKTAALEVQARLRTMIDSAA